MTMEFVVILVKAKVFMEGADATELHGFPRRDLVVDNGIVFANGAYSYVFRRAEVKDSRISETIMDITGITPISSHAYALNDRCPDDWLKEAAGREEIRYAIDVFGKENIYDAVMEELDGQMPGVFHVSLLLDVGVDKSEDDATHTILGKHDAEY